MPRELWRIDTYNIQKNQITKLNLLCYILPPQKRKIACRHSLKGGDSKNGNSVIHVAFLAAYHIVGQ